MMETRYELEVRLEAAGIYRDVADTILSATAPARHEWRVEECRRVVEAHTEGRKAAALCLYLAEAIGVGGRLGLGQLTGYSPATDRCPPFDRLGKGRRHATDGDAWTAAIHTAAWRDYPKSWDQGHAWRLTPHRQGGDALSEIVDSEGDILHQSSLLSVVPERWQVPVLYGVLMRLLSREDPCPIGDASPMLRWAAIQGEPAEWSAIIEMLLAHAAEQAARTVN